MQNQNSPLSPSGSVSQTEIPDSLPADLQSLSQQFSEAKTYLASYIDAQWERAQISLKEVVSEVVLGGLTLFLLYGLILIAFAFICYGVALGLGQVFGNQPWLGYVAAGAGFLLLSFAFLLFYWSKVKNKSLNKRIKDYEQELEKQRAQFGRTAIHQAASPSQK